MTVGAPVDQAFYPSKDVDFLTSVLIDDCGMEHQEAVNAVHVRHQYSGPNSYAVVSVSWETAVLLLVAGHEEIVREWGLLTKKSLKSTRDFVERSCFTPDTALDWWRQKRYEWKRDILMSSAERWRRDAAS